MSVLHKRAKSTQKSSRSAELSHNSSSIFHERIRKNLEKHWATSTALVLLVVILAVLVFTFHLYPHNINAVRSAGSTTLTGISVSGNHFVDGNGKTVVLHGVDRSGTEYMCVQDNGIFDGPSDAASVAAIASWQGVNVVRVPLNEDCWLGINGVNPAYSGANYQTAIENYVSLLHSYGLYAILELHWSAPGTTAATYQENLPDYDHSPDMWASVADAFKNDPDTIFDVFNEPNNIDMIGCATGAPAACQTYINSSNANWWCWMQGTGCITSQNSATFGDWQVASAQDLINAIRGTGATNVIMVGGEEYANDMSEWLNFTPTDPDHQLAASFHLYSFNPCNTLTCVQQSLTPILQAGYPVVVGETGDDCSVSFINPFWDWFDSQGISYLAWTWDTWGGCDNVLISDYSGTPSAGFGAGYQTHLAGLTNTTTPPSVPTGLTSPSQTTSSISLSWTASSAGTNPVSGYNVYRSGTKVGTTSNTSYTDSGLSANTSYSYTVSAYDSSGNTSAQSSASSFSTLANTPTPPSVPTGLTSPSQTSSSISLSWTASSAGTNPVSGYNIYRNGTKVGTSSTTSYTDGSLSASTSYSYTVSAYDASGNTSAQSSSSSFSTLASSPTAPSVPTGLNSPSQTDSTINLAWTASTGGSGSTSYNIYRNGTKVGTSSTTSYTDTGLSANTSYSYTISAYGNNNATSAQSSTSSFKTFITADINGDGVVNVFDLSILLSHWGETGASYAQGDLNGDGVVNVFDLSILLSHWGDTAG
jgi:chitodextrinase